MIHRELTALEANIGRMIRVRRLARGLALTDLAKALRVTFQAVQQWEQGVRRISAADLYRVARKLDTPVGWFFGKDAAPAERWAETDYAAAAEAMALCPEMEAVPRLAPAQLAAVRSLIASIAPPLAEQA